MPPKDKVIYGKSGARGGLTGEDVEELPSEVNPSDPTTYSFFTDQLTETSAPARLAAISALTKHYVLNPDSDGISETMVTNACNIIRGRKPGDGERVAAGSLVRILLLCSGEERHWKCVYDSLMASVGPTGSGTSRTEAIRVLGLGALAACVDEAESKEVANAALACLCSDRAASTSLHEAAAQALALVMTSLPSAAVKSLSREAVGPCADLLLSDSLEIRLAAGRLLALIFAMDAIVGDKQMPIGHELDLAGLVEKISDMAEERKTSNKNKEELKEQRTVFRDIAATIEDGSPPELCNIKLGSETVATLTSWAGLLRYEAVKEATQGRGFQTHLARNEVVQGILGATVTGTPQKKLTSMEKRKYMSPNSEASKTRDQGRGKERQVNAQMLAQPMEED